MALLLGTASLAQAQGGAAPAAPKPAPGAAAKKPGATSSTADMNKASYSIGLQFGTQMKRAHLDSKNISLAEIQRGIREGLAGKEFGREDMEAIQSYVTGIQEKVADENHAKATKFLAENAKKPGVQTTSSGLQYKVLQPGSGTPPKRTDTVSVNYTGRLLDGTEFDGTDKHGGQPASFPLNGVIPCWTEGLQQMEVGGKAKLYCPPNTAYGDAQAGPIPPGSLLVFDVELLEVND